MSKRTEVVVLIALALMCGGAFYFTAESTVVPMVARGAGPDGVQVTGSGWLQLLLSGLGAGGFSIASIVAILKHGAELIPTGWQRDAVNTAVDVGQIGLYQKLYAGSKDTSERAKLREAAKIVNDTLFDGWFPADSPVTKA